MVKYVARRIGEGNATVFVVCYAVLGDDVV
jgi:hypothetical protein